MPTQLFDLEDLQDEALPKRANVFASNVEKAIPISQPADGSILILRDTRGGQFFIPRDTQTLVLAFATDELGQPSGRQYICLRMPLPGSEQADLDPIADKNTLAFFSALQPNQIGSTEDMRGLQLSKSPRIVRRNEM